MLYPLLPIKPRESIWLTRRALIHYSRIVGSYRVQEGKISWVDPQPRERTDRCGARPMRFVHHIRTKLIRRLMHKLVPRQHVYHTITPGLLVQRRVRDEEEIWKVSGASTMVASYQKIIRRPQG
jgi:hypothetical protein